MRKLIETIIYYLKFKENNENEMAVHAIYFDFYYCRQLTKRKRESSKKDKWLKFYHEK